MSERVENQNNHQPASTSKRATFAVLLSVLLVVLVIAWNKSNSSLNRPTKPYTVNKDSDYKRDYRYVHKTVNMRSGPSTNDDITLVVKRGEKLELLSKNGDWSKVKNLDGVEGYIFSNLLKYSDIPDIEIVNWNWQADRDFTSAGSVIWMVELRNNTSRYIDAVKVEISIYDKQGRLTETDYTYVKGLPPGGTASDKNYATYYGTEHKASIRVVN